MWMMHDVASLVAEKTLLSFFDCSASVLIWEEGRGGVYHNTKREDGAKRTIYKQKRSVEGRPRSTVTGWAEGRRMNG